MYIYFWRWGNEARRWSPTGLPGGINGRTDQRLTRYLAARMGPLPGWAMGYGFSLGSWARDHVDDWQQYFQEKMGWPHLLSARSRVFQDPNATIQGYEQGDEIVTNPNLGLETLRNPSYGELSSLLNSDSDRPHLLEERNVQGRWGVTDEETRQLLWKTAMAGGVGGWYGHFTDDVVFGGATGYTNPDQLACHRSFWENRFLLDLAPANDLSSSGAWILKSSNNHQMVAYQREASVIEIDLSDFGNAYHAVAVDAKSAYEEIDLGLLAPGTQKIQLPYASDWALAVGNFDDLTEDMNQPPVADLVANITLGEAPLLVSFDGSGSSDPDDDTLSFSWDFGDGATSQDPTVDHTFQVAGLYSVQLMVEDGAGKSTTASTLITVTAPPVSVAGVEFDVEQVTVAQNTTATLSYQVLPMDATDQAVSWQVADPLIAQVNGEGLLTGISEGTTMVTVTTLDGGFSDELIVVVEPLTSDAIDNLTMGDQPAKQYGVHEIAFLGDGGVANPSDTDLEVTFTSPTGSDYTIFGFYDGGNEWKARLYVNEAGTWTWTSTSIDDPGLHNQTGSFVALTSTLRGKLRKHATKGNAWQTDDGEWFLNIGDTPYFLFHPSETLWKEYVAEIAELGITMMRCSVLGALNPNVQDPGGWEMIFADNQNNFLDLIHFQRTDRRMKWLLNNYPEMYIQLIIVPRSNTGYNNDETFWKNLSTTQRNRYLEELLARYGAFPQVFYQVANDYNCTLPNNTAMFDYIGNYLEAHDPWSSLTSTGCVRGAPFPFTNRAWADYVHIETLDALAAEQVDLYSADMHVFAGEDRYETHRPMDHPAVFMRRLMWSWLLSEGSAAYGGDWDTIRPYSTTSLTGLDDIRYIKDFIEGHKIDLSAFDADNNLVHASARGAERPQATKTFDNEKWLIYHPNATRSDEAANVASGTASMTIIDLPTATYDYVWMRADDGTTLTGLLNHPGGSQLLESPWAGVDVVFYAEKTGDYEPTPVTGVSLGLDGVMTLPEGQFVQLLATVVPPDAAMQEVSWQSSNSEVAMVTPAGRVTALAEGMALVSVRTLDGGFEDSIIIEVGPATDLPWLEDFADLSDGSTTDHGSTAWNADQGGLTSSRGLFEVRNEALVVTSTNRNDGQFVTWTTEEVDISPYASIQVSLDLRSEGQLEEQGQWIDFVKVYYLLDNNAPQPLAEFNGNFNGDNWLTATSIPLTGTTLSLLIEARTTSTAETYFIDNVAIISSGVGAKIGFEAHSGSDLTEDELHIREAVPLYPNPTTSFIYVPTEVQVVHLMSVDGKRFEIRPVNARLDLSKLASGVYSVTYRQGATMVYTRIIKR